jgi:hypothetical protein
LREWPEGESFLAHAGLSPGSARIPRHLQQRPAKADTQ